MEINPKCKLFLKNVHYYDLKKAYYNLLISLGYDVSNIPEEKEKRNIAIGLLIRDNPQIGHILRPMVNNIIDKTLSDNNVSEEELITRQFDGIIVTKKLDNILDNFVHLIYKEFIISPNRKFYLTVDNDNKVIVKGISKRYDYLKKIYQMFSEINYLSKSAIFKKLDKIKDLVLESTDVKLFCIPNNKDENKVDIVLHRHGAISIKLNTIGFLNTKDINKKWYYDHYFRPFIESIFIEFV